MNYKVKCDTGPWKAGDVISDKDVETWPAGGGVKRLRDKIGALEDTTEKRRLASEGTPEELAPENTGNTKPGASTADIGPGGEAPNAGSQRRSGK